MTLPDLEVPRGPVTVPFAVVDVPLLVVVPFAVDVPPLGPLTLALPAVPVLVFATVAEPLTDLPRAPVALPLVLTVFPFCVTEPEAVEPLGPVTVFCAWAEGRKRVMAMPAAAIHFMFVICMFMIGLLVRNVLDY